MMGDKYVNNKHILTFTTIGLDARGQGIGRLIKMPLFRRKFLAQNIDVLFWIRNRYGFV